MSKTSQASIKQFELVYCLPILVTVLETDSKGCFQGRVDMAAALVFEIFGKAQTSTAVHKRCSLQLRRIQSQCPDDAFKQAIHSVTLHLVAANSAAAGTKRLIRFLSAACAAIDGEQNDVLGLILLDVGVTVRRN